MKKKQLKVFLGGTCNNSKWREKLIKKLNIDYFNPVVDDWDEEAQKREIKERKISKFVLYTITPLMKGVYSIAEVVDDSNKQPESTIFCILQKDEDKKFDKEQLKSLNQVAKMVKENGAQVFSNLNDVAEYLNKQTHVNEETNRMLKLSGM